MSLIIRQLNFPVSLIARAAVRYLRRNIAPGSPAVESSNSPALVTIGCNPIFLHANSTFIVLPQPLCPQIPKINAGDVAPSAPLSFNKFFTTCVATRSANRSGT